MKVRRVITFSSLQQSNNFTIQGKQFSNSVAATKSFNKGYNELNSIITMLDNLKNVRNFASLSNFDGDVTAERLKTTISYFFVSLASVISTGISFCLIFNSSLLFNLMHQIACFPFLYFRRCI